MKTPTSRRTLPGTRKMPVPADATVFPAVLAPVIAEISDVAGVLWERRWAERNAGNLSVDVTPLMGDKTSPPRGARRVDCDHPIPELAGSWILITSAGSRMRDVARTPGKYLGVIWIAENGKGCHLVWSSSPDYLPTSELESHLRIHQMLRQHHRPERSVLHTHPDGLIAMTHITEFKDERRLNSVLWGMHPEAVMVVPSGVGFVPYLRTGTVEIAEATVHALENHTVALWEKHGCFALGVSPLDAFDAVDMMEKSARIFLMVKSAGRSPEGLTDEQVEELAKAFALW